MRNSIKSLVALCAIGSITLLAGCQKEGLSRKGEVKELNFGAVAHSFGDKTRTVYGDYNSDKTFQEIKWESTDAIRIYSPDAARRVGVETGSEDVYYWADYRVTPKSDPTKGSISNLTEDGFGEANGLAWEYGGETEEYTFYSLYPAPVTDEGKGNALSACNGTFNLSIPSGNQGFSEGGNISSYGYMTAIATPNPAQLDSEIELDFYPAFTTFEISIRSAADAIALSQFDLTTTGTNALTGDYSVIYTGDDASSVTYNCSAANSASTPGKTITVNLQGKSAPAASANKDLTFSVLALPQDLTNLSVSFTTSTGSVRTLKLNTAAGQPISFTGGKKHRIYGLALANGELLISVGTAPWVGGGDVEYVTIENVTTLFQSYQRWNDEKSYGEGSWSYDNYVAIAPGRSETEVVDPNADPQVLNHRPLYSPMLTLKTINVGVPLELRSDNDKIGFVTIGSDGVYGAPTSTLSIRASEDLDDPVETSYFVVPVDDTAIGETANISLVRADEYFPNVPIAYSHKDMPGSTDHTKVPFKVLSVEAYQSETNTEIPSI